MRSLSPLILLAALAACTDAGVYALQGSGVPGPDRTAFEGDVCVPLAAGDTFPVKVLFVIEGGNTVSASTVGAIINAIQDSALRGGTNVKFALAAYHVLAQGLQGSFVDGTTMLGQLVNYPAFQQVGPVSIRSALKSLKSGMPLVIFPEGGRTRDGRIRPFLPGAFFLAIKARVDIVPVALIGTYDLLPMDTYHIKCRPLAMRVGRPISTAGLSGHDMQALSEKVQKAVCELHDNLSERPAPQEA